MAETIIAIAGALLVGVVLLLLEYRTSWFQQHVLHRTKRDEVSKEASTLFDSESGSVESSLLELLVRDAEANVVYLIDRYGLPHAIRDQETALYFEAMLGYQQDELRKVPPDELKPAGAEVISLRDWHRQLPKTKEDELAHEARASLKVEKGKVKVEDGVVVLPFHLRYDSEDNFQLDSARCVFESDAPVSEADISVRNTPAIRGLLACTLLFADGSKSKNLLAKEQYTLSLFFQERLSLEEVERLARQRLGWIEFSGVFRGTQVSFHKPF